MKKLTYLILLIIYSAAIFFFTSTPSLPEVLPTGSDKILHFLGFFILTLIFLKTLSFYKIKNRLITGFAVTYLIAIITELIQLNISGRTFSWFDIIADTLGIILALIIKCNSSKQ